MLTQKTSRYYSDDNQYPLDEDMQANYYFDYDYIWGSGFEHGHICPSADRLYSREANYQTFFLTNMQPQYKAFNGSFNGSDSYKNELSPWYRLEDKVRQLARQLDSQEVLEMLWPTTSSSWATPAVST